MLADADPVALVHSVNERVINGRDLSVLEDALGPGFVSHTSGDDLDGAAFRVMIASLLTALPDARVETDLTVAAGDLVAWRSITTGTHSAEWLGVPSSGRRVSWSAIHIARVESGRIQEHWGSPDIAGLVAQLTGEAH